ncbi:MAG: O-antigen ligase family protein [Burkholderiales bacterium]
MRSRPDAASTPSRGAFVRARVFALLQFSTAFWACTYFALVAISGHTYFRSLAFGLAAAFALWLVLGSLFSDNEPMPVPDGWLVAAILAWAGWSAASLAWSINPAFSRAEFGTEVGWGLATTGVFYVAARGPAPFRAVNATAIAVAAFLSVLAVHLLTAPGNAGPEVVLQRSHAGVGAFSTLLVLVLPLLPLLLAPRPVGFGAGPWQLAVAVVVFALLLVAARLTENRMIWVALAAGFVVAALLAGWRWRARLARAPLRWGAVLLVLLVVLAALFVDAMRERARTDFNGSTSVAQAIAEDPRLVLWQHTFERIRERPWTGFGFGKSILREQLRAETGHPLLLHAHNLFVSQWLQTGAIGVATLLALLAAVAWRYWRFLRAPDGILAVIGLAGLVMLAAFVVKNLTDDFMVRPTSREFWALNACLIGYGMRRARIA